MYTVYVIKDRVTGNYLCRCTEHDLLWQVQNPLLAHIHSELTRCNGYVKQLQKYANKYITNRKHDLVAVSISVDPLGITEMEQVDVVPVQGYTVRARFVAKGRDYETTLLKSAKVGDWIERNGIDQIFRLPSYPFNRKIYKTVEGAQKVCDAIERYNRVFVEEHLSKMRDGDYIKQQALTVVFDVIPYSE